MTVPSNCWYGIVYRESRSLKHRHQIIHKNCQSPADKWGETKTSGLGPWRRAGQGRQSSYLGKTKLLGGVARRGGVSLPVALPGWKGTRRKREGKRGAPAEGRGKGDACIYPASRRGRGRANQCASLVVGLVASPVWPVPLPPRSQCSQQDRHTTAKRPSGRAMHFIGRRGPLQGKRSKSPWYKNMHRCTPRAQHRYPECQGCNDSSCKPEVKINSRSGVIFLLKPNLAHSN